MRYTILAIVAILGIVGIIMMAHIKKKETHAPAETGQAGQTQPPSQPQPLSLEDGLKAHNMLREVVESDLERIRAETQARQEEALAIAKAIQEYSDSRIEKILEALALKEKEPIERGIERGVSSSTPPAGGQIKGGQIKININITPLPYPRTGGWGYSWGYKRYPQQRYPQPKQIEDYPVPDPDSGSGPETPRTKHSRRRIGGEVARIGLDFAQHFAYGWALTGKPGRSAGAAAINVGAAAARRRAGL